MHETAHHILFIVDRHKLRLVRRFLAHEEEDSRGDPLELMEHRIKPKHHYPRNVVERMLSETGFLLLAVFIGEVIGALFMLLASCIDCPEECSC